MKWSKTISICAVLLVVLTAVTGCQSANVDSSQDAGTIQLTGSAIASSHSAVNVDGATATISAAGTYTLTGTLDDGQIRINAPSGTVTLVLDNANITCFTGAPIYAEKADKVVITLPEGTDSTITDGMEYVLAGTETEPDAALFSREDLVINGQGALTVNANYNDGIASRDTLLIESGTITVTAKNHGIKGKDYLMVNDGAITVASSGDGIKATNDSEAAMGYVEINGGNLIITAQDEGISAITRVTINGGEISIETANNGIKSDDTIDIKAGTVTIITEDKGLVCTTQTGSAAASVTVNGIEVLLP